MFKKFFVCACALTTLISLENVEGMREALRNRYGNAYADGNAVAQQQLQNPNGNPLANAQEALAQVRPDQAWVNEIEEALSHGFALAFETSGGAISVARLRTAAGTPANAVALGNAVFAAQKAISLAVYQLTHSQNYSLSVAQWTALCAALNGLMTCGFSGNAGNAAAGAANDLNGEALLNAQHLGNTPKNVALGGGATHLDTAANWSEVVNVALFIGLDNADANKLGADANEIFDRSVVLAHALAAGKVNPAQLGGAPWGNAAQNANMPSDAKVLRAIVRLSTGH